MKKIAIFSSGAGSNAAKLIEYATESKAFEVALIVTNVEEAGVIDVAKKHNVELLEIDRLLFYYSTELVDMLKEREISLVVLAGFLWLVPGYFIKMMKGKIINLHPSMLPKYGGKGMYGKRVHRAVIDAGEDQTGITVHWVNEAYDDGAIIQQAEVPVEKGDTVNSLTARIQETEHQLLPKVVAELLA